MQRQAIAVCRYSAHRIPRTQVVIAYGGERSSREAARQSGFTRHKELRPQTGIFASGDASLRWMAMSVRCRTDRQYPLMAAVGRFHASTETQQNQCGVESAVAIGISRRSLIAALCVVWHASRSHAPNSAKLSRGPVVIALRTRRVHRRSDQAKSVQFSPRRHRGVRDHDCNQYPACATYAP